MEAPRYIKLTPRYDAPQDIILSRVVFNATRNVVNKYTAGSESGDHVDKYGDARYSDIYQRFLKTGRGKLYKKDMVAVLLTRDEQVYIQSMFGDYKQKLLGENNYKALCDMTTTRDSFERRCEIASRKLDIPKNLSNIPIPMHLYERQPQGHT